MSVGEKIRAVCPYEEAYGSSQVGDIPAKSDIHFVLELVSLPEDPRKKDL